MGDFVILRFNGWYGAQIQFSLIGDFNSMLPSIINVVVMPSNHVNFGCHVLCIIYLVILTLWGIFSLINFTIRKTCRIK